MGEPSPSERGYLLRKEANSGAIGLLFYTMHMKKETKSAYILNKPLFTTNVLQSKAEEENGKASGFLTAQSYFCNFCETLQLPV
jgi:hypothetical protein